MKKTDKYYKLIRMPQREYQINNWLSEIPNYSEVVKKINPNDDYLLMERSCFVVTNDEGVEEHDELFTNAFSFSGNEDRLYKIIGNKDCYDYSGLLAKPIIHHKKKVYTFDDYCNLPKK